MQIKLVNHQLPKQFTLHLLMFVYKKRKYIDYKFRIKMDTNNEKSNINKPKTKEQNSNASLSSKHPLKTPWNILNSQLTGKREGS